VLNLIIVQVLAGISLASLVGGFLLGHALDRSPRHPAHVVAKSDSGRWTEVVWVGGALVAALWPIGVLLVPTYAYHSPPVPDFPGSSAVQVVGFLVSLAGGLLFFAAVRALGRHMTPEIRVEQGHRLVQEGPYRYIRHPAYTAIVTGAGGLSVVYLSVPLALLTLLLAGLATYRAHLEEQLLRSGEAFGATYTAYIARTGRFLPRLRSKS